MIEIMKKLFLEICDINSVLESQVYFKIVKRYSLNYSESMFNKLYIDEIARIVEIIEGKLIDD